MFEVQDSRHAWPEPSPHLSREITGEGSRVGVGIVGVRIVGAEGDAAFCGADEIHQLDYFASEDGGFFETLDCQLEVLAGAEQDRKSLAQCLNRFGRDAWPLQAPHVDAAQRVGAGPDAET